MTREEGVFFESFYRLHFQKLVGYAYRFLKNWDDAKEVVQEAFLTGMVKIDRFYGSENRLGWIKNVIRNKAQNLNTVKKSRATVTISIEDTNLCPSAFDYYVGVDAPSAHCAELLSEQPQPISRSGTAHACPAAAAAQQPSRMRSAAPSIQRRAFRWKR